MSQGTETMFLMAEAIKSKMVIRRPAKRINVVYDNNGLIFLEL